MTMHCTEGSVGLFAVLKKEKKKPTPKYFTPTQKMGQTNIRYKIR